MRRSHDVRLQGTAYAVAAFLSWGVLPLFWKLLDGQDTLEVLAHRLLWTFVCVALIGTAGRRWAAALRVLASPRILATFGLSGALIAVNWFTYLEAVNTGRVLESSMGYFINPLLSVLLGAVFLKEPLGGWQGTAVALAGAGVLIVLVEAGRLPWIALTLAVTFGLYGLLKKTAGVEALTGQIVESLLLAAVALGYLVFVSARGSGLLPGSGAHTWLLLLATGPVTALPVLWFTEGARRIPLAAVGFIQYLVPTAFLLLGLLVFHEPFGAARLASFSLIWAGIAVYTVAEVRAGRSKGRIERAESDENKEV